jgi:hypothetical protein
MNDHPFSIFLSASRLARLLRIASFENFETLRDKSLGSQDFGFYKAGYFHPAYAQRGDIHYNYIWIDLPG